MAGVVALERTGFAANAPAPTTQPTPAAILTPKAGPGPRINGPKVFGLRPGHPVIYTIPATGDRPMTFAADNLPEGLTLDAQNGRISGSIGEGAAGDHVVTLHAKNAAGEASRAFKVVVGETIALTPPMGWNSYNVFGTHCDEKTLRAQAAAMAGSGLIDHGWTYLNIDDGWQGPRGGEFHSIQPDPARFDDMKAFADYVHGLGLKVGIYSTPWVESYGHRTGGSAENPEGTFTPVKEKIPKNKKILPYALGKYSFAQQDAKQWAAWGYDYLKYDWNPIETPQVKEMYDALRNSGRDVVLSLSNSAPFATVADWSPYANAWRTSGDIRDTWQRVSSIGFAQSKWTPFARPGHWNDTDMLVVGWVGWGKPRPNNLTADEQYTHISLWCLLSAPMILGCDMTKLDDFTLNLVTNDEVLDVDQDPLGKQASRVSERGQTQVWAKEMEDGSKAVGLFNLGDAPSQVAADWSEIGAKGKQTVRDLWRQKDLGTFDDQFTTEVPAHGVVLVRVRSK